MLKRTPLPRPTKPIARSPLARSVKPLKQKRSKPRRGPSRCQPYKDWLRDECRCVACKTKVGILETKDWLYRIIDPAHTENNGMRSKGPDSSCAPLCREHHNRYDAGRDAFEEKYGLDMKAEGAAHWKIWSEVINAK